MSRLIIVLSLVAFVTVELTPSVLFAEELNSSTPSAVFKPKPLKKAIGPNKTLLLDHFDHPSGVNLLGGLTQGDEEEPGGLIPSYTPTGRLTMGKMGHSLKMDYNVTIPMSIAFYWTRFGPWDPKAQNPASTQPINIEGYNYLSFWLKSDRDYPRFSIEFHQDTNQDHRFTLGQDINAKIAVSSFILSPARDIWGGVSEVMVSIDEKDRLIDRHKIIVVMSEKDRDIMTDQVPTLLIF